MSRPVALAAAALAVSTPGVARAYGVERTASGAVVHWTAFPVRYRVDLEDTAATDRRWVLRTIRRGPEAWTLPSGSAAYFDYLGTTTAGLTPGDGITSFTFVTHGWPADLGDGTITAAATLLGYDAKTGALSEADVGFNDAGFRFADETADPSALDLWSISAHEAGHVLGLAHDCGAAGQPGCAGAPAAVTGALMYPAAVPGDTSRRAPTADDLAGLASIYGSGDAVPPAGAMAPRACPGDPTTFVPVPGSPPATGFEVVDADTGAVRPVYFSDEADGDHLAIAPAPGQVLDVVATGASGKARALYGALVSLPSCAADGGPPARPPPGGCGCGAATGGDVLAPIVVVLGLAGLKGARR